MLVPSFFNFTHIDPACDPPEAYQEAFELLAEIFGRLQGLRDRHCEDVVLHCLTLDLERQIVAAGLILAIQIERLARP
ncbi:hypothetical protein XH90_13200 [Bradyrhizobium sp. CCBAU 53338]|nr:hypothetical protein XH90_13200 [Bradyrhizobium sp. CCBAU 53338]